MYFQVKFKFNFVILPSEGAGGRKTTDEVRRWGGFANTQVLPWFAFVFPLSCFVLRSTLDCLAMTLGLSSDCLVTILFFLVLVTVLSCLVLSCLGLAWLVMSCHVCSAPALLSSRLYPNIHESTTRAIMRSATTSTTLPLKPSGRTLTPPEMFSSSSWKSLTSRSYRVLSYPVLFFPVLSLSFYVISPLFFSSPGLSFGGG